MANRANRIADDYAEAVFARARARIEPAGFDPDWSDQPARYKTYPGAIRIPLPAGMPAGVAPLRDLMTAPSAVAGTTSPPDQRVRLGRLAALLRLSYGLLDRRLDVTWNNDSLGRTSYPHAVWGRGTASGGGLYPLEIYWCGGPTAPLLPGVYHYAAGHHAFARLATGDITGQVRAVAGHHGAVHDTDQFLVVAVRLWRNAFKYNNFAYQVVSQDVGALLGTWQLLARGLGLGLAPLMWFADERLNRLIGLETRDESAFALVALRFGAETVDRQQAGRLALPCARLVTRVAVERSRIVGRFAMVDAVHSSALVDNEQRPAPTAAPATADVCDAMTSAGRSTPVPLPPVSLPDTDLAHVLRARRSSFGRFVTTPHVTLGELATVLGVTAAARRFPGDHKRPDGQPHLTSLMVFAHRIVGLPSGRYGYDEATHSLTLVPSPAESSAPVADVLQQNYLLLNYDMGRVSAVVAIVGRPAACVDAYGNRGLRLLNAEVGAVAQVGYLAATALRVGCGAVLGFDNVGMNEDLGLVGSDRRTLLFLLLGRHPRTVAAVDADLAAPRWTTNGVRRS